MHVPSRLRAAAYPNLLNRSSECELGLLVAHGDGTTCPEVQVLLVAKYIMSNQSVIDVFNEPTSYCIDSSYSFIQLLPFNTSRGRVPSGGPTMPSFSITSIRCAARP